MTKSIFATIVIFAMIASMTFSAFSQHGEINKIPHGINPHSESQIWPGFALTTGSTRKTTALNYYGGPLIQTPTIYIIWYGNWNQSNGSDNAAGQQIVRDWGASIGGSPYYRLNTTYNVSGNATWGGETTDGGTSPSLSDT